MVLGEDLFNVRALGSTTVGSVGGDFVFVAVVLTDVIGFTVGVLRP